MKKRVFSLLCAALLTVCLCLSALGAPFRLVDEADLITAEEEAAVLARLDDLSADYGMDVVVYTTSTLNGYSVRDFADSALDNSGYDRNAILLLISMEDRDVYISTAGRAITVFSDSALDEMLSRVIPFLSDGDYADAFLAYADRCEAYLVADAAGAIAPSRSYSHGFDYAKAAGIAVLIGLVVAIIVTAIMKGKLKSVRKKHNAGEFIIPGSLNVTHSRDMYLFSNVTRRPRPQQKTGGSSTHISAGGVSHGGRGGKF